MQNLNLTLHQLELSVLVDKNGPRARLFLGPLRNKELKQALQRALNTWDDAPQWLFDLDRALTEDPVPRAVIVRHVAVGAPVAIDGFVDATQFPDPSVFEAEPVSGPKLYGDGWGVV